MLKVRKRIDGIPIFDKLDRPLYHLNSEEENEKYVVVVDEINTFEGHYIELNDCLKEKYEKINIYTKSPLSSNSFTVEDQSSIKSVLGWISKWNNKKKLSKNVIIKSKSKYVGELNHEIPLIIKLFKYNKNKKIETNTICCNVYTESNILENKNKPKKSKKNIKLIEKKKKQNKKSTQKPNLLCLPIISTKFNWLKKKEQKEIDIDLSIDDIQYQNSNLNDGLPIISNEDCFKSELNQVETIETIENNNEVENSIFRNSHKEVSDENSKESIINSEEEYLIETVIEHDKDNNDNLYTSNNKKLSQNLSVKTLCNDYLENSKYQELHYCLSSPCNSSASTLVSPVSSDTSKETSNFEIDSCDYADYLKEKLSEHSEENTEVTELERKHFSLPLSTENTKNRRNRRRSYAFSLTSNEFNLIYSEANHAVISGLCKTVENKQSNQVEKEEPDTKISKEEKPFVKGHNRTKSKHRRSNAVCLTNDQLLSFENEDSLKQNNGKNKYINSENSITSSPTNTILNLNTKFNKDTQLKRRSTNIIKYKNSNSSLSSSNSYCSNSGSMRLVSTNRLSRDIEMLRAMKISKSLSVPKLDQPESVSPNRNPINSRFSMDGSSYKDSTGIGLRNNSSNNFIRYSFNYKGESNSWYRKDNCRGSYNDIINQQYNKISRFSNISDSNSGSSTYYYSEEDSVHSNNNESHVTDSKEDYGTNNSNFNESENIIVQQLPPTPMVNMI